MTIRRASHPTGRVDLRNNNGGFVNVYATDVFARRPYLVMKERGYPEAPARTRLLPLRSRMVRR